MNFEACGFLLSVPQALSLCDNGQKRCVGQLCLPLVVLFHLWEIHVHHENVFIQVGLLHHSSIFSSLLSVQGVLWANCVWAGTINMSSQQSALPPWTEEDIRKVAPRMPEEGPKILPEYLEQQGQLDIHQALWLWMGYRQQEWQQADVRVSRMVSKQNGSWYWTLEIVLPIAGKPGLEVRGLAHAVARLPPHVPPSVPGASSIVSESVTENKVEFSTPPRQQSLKRSMEGKFDEECEVKRVMYMIDALAKSPGSMFSNSPQSGNAVVSPSSASMAKVCKP